MKSFVIKGMVFIVFIAVIMQGLNLSYMHNDPFDVKRFQEVPNGIEVCNVGASYSRYSFNYEDYDDEFVTFNFGLSSQSCYYDFEIMDYYRNKLNDGSIVFIVLSHPMFLGYKETEYDDFLWKNQRYYYFLPPDKIRNYDIKTDIKLKVAPFTIAKCTKNILDGLIAQNEFNESWSQETDEEQLSEYIEKENYAHFVNNKLIDGKMIYLQEAVDSIYKMIALCKEEGCIPILLMTPLTEAYKDYIDIHDKETLEKIYDIINEIQRNTGIEFYDYSSDERFCRDLSLFCNGDHLNKDGAKKFTETVMDEIVKKHLNEYIFE